MDAALHVEICGTKVRCQLVVNCCASEIAAILQHHLGPPGPYSPVSRLPISDINDATTTTTTTTGTRLIITLRGDADIETTIVELSGVWGIHATKYVSFGQPLPTVLRAWVDLHAGGDLDERLALVGRGAG